MAKVLLVEDDNNLREIYQARLMAEGYDIVAAQNGEEALVMAKQNKPDLIISDVMMPRISGFEMLDILRNTDELKSTKVIMLTALGQAEDQTRADNLGADKYLVKSQVTLEDIVNAAKELLGEDGAAPEPAAAAAPTPADSAAASAAPAAAPAAAAEPTVPASVVPQPDTAVVVPPAPANPEPPTVTAVPMAAAPADDAAATTPATEPAASANTPDATAAEASVASSAPQSMEAEEASLQAKIDGYAAAPATSTPAATPETTSNDQTIASAVEQLNAGTSDTPADAAPAAAPTPDAAAPTPAPAAPVADSTSDQVAVNGKKIIQPLANTSTPNGADLNALLAKEEAKEQATTPGATPAPSSAPAADAPAAPTPTPPNSVTPNGVDHNSITL